MSRQDKTKDTLAPRVMVMEPQPPEGITTATGPRVIATTESGKIVPAPAAELRPIATVTGKRRKSLAVRLGLTGLTVAVCGWLGIDLYLWIDAAFGSSPMLGYAASAAATIGIVGALAIIVHEMRTYLALKNVEANQQRFTTGWETIRPADAQHCHPRRHRVDPEGPRQQGGDRGIPAPGAAPSHAGAAT